MFEFDISKTNININKFIKVIYSHNGMIEYIDYENEVVTAFFYNEVDLNKVITLLEPYLVMNKLIKKF